MAANLILRPINLIPELVVAPVNNIRPTPPSFPNYIRIVRRNGLTNGLNPAEWQALISLQEQVPDESNETDPLIRR